MSSELSHKAAEIIAAVLAKAPEEANEVLDYLTTDELGELFDAIDYLRVSIQRWLQSALEFPE